MEHTSRQITCYAVKLTSSNLKEQKSYKECYHTVMERNQILTIKSSKIDSTWRLNNIFLNNQKVTEEIKSEIKRFLETNDNENMTTQNLWDAAKAVLRGKFIAIQSHHKKQEKHHIET